MEYRVLGRTGMVVSAIGLGAGSFGKFGNSTEKDCICIAHYAFDQGVNLIDTADQYSVGESEIITGKAIADRRDKIILTTKCGSRFGPGFLEIGGSRRWIHMAVDRALKRLNTDYIDLFQLHRPDSLTDISETLHAFNELIRAGKVRCFGMSNTPPELLVEASLRADMRGLLGPHSEQGPYSIFDRRVEAAVLPVCQKFGMGFMAYSPLDSGFLSGRYRHGKEKEFSPRHGLMPPAAFDLSARHNVTKLDAVEKLITISEDAGIDFTHFSLAFVAAHPAVSTILVGGAKMHYFEKYLAGKDVWLSNEILDKIDAVVAPGTSLNAGVLVSPPALVDSGLRRRVTREHVV